MVQEIFLGIKIVTGAKRRIAESVTNLFGLLRLALLLVGLYPPPGDFRS